MEPLLLELTNQLLTVCLIEKQSTPLPSIRTGSEHNSSGRAQRWNSLLCLGDNVNGPSLSVKNIVYRNLAKSNIKQLIIIKISIVPINRLVIIKHYI